MRMRKLGMAASGGLALLLAACSGPPTAKHERALGFAIKREMDVKGVSASDPILMRIFKQESQLEVWKRDKTGRYKHLKTYEICKWSGQLGPKHKEGDKQAPEGFYHVTPGQMNPNSSYHLSFNLGYPNEYDRVHGRTGAHLMVHGDCLSAGCYAMEDPQIEELYALAREAFRGGQKSFQVQALPFRMTPQNIARSRNDPNARFWRNLKEGADHFEVTRQAPKVDVCGKRYVFNAQNTELDPAAACPELEVPEAIRTAVAEKAKQDEQAIQVAIARLEAGGGLPPQSANVQIARGGQSAGETPQAGSGGLMSRVPRLRVPGFGGGQPSPVATSAIPESATGYAPQQGQPAEDPFAVFDMFVTVDARTLPRSAVGSRLDDDPAGTR